MGVTGPVRTRQAYQRPHRLALLETPRPLSTLPQQTSSPRASRLCWIRRSGFVIALSAGGGSNNRGRRYSAFRRGRRAETGLSVRSGGATGAAELFSSVKPLHVLDCFLQLSMRSFASASAFSRAQPPPRGPYAIGSAARSARLCQWAIALESLTVSRGWVSPVPRREQRCARWLHCPPRVQERHRPRVSHAWH